MSATTPQLPQPPAFNDTRFNSLSATSSTRNRVLSHWTKSTPEEGIQVIFSTAEVLQSEQNGVQVETHPPTAERPCQWGINLRLIHTPSSPTPAEALSSPTAPTSATTAKPVGGALPSPSHLVLTLDRLFQNSMSMGTGTDDPARAGRTRSDAYRTLYIYSPRLKRDICVHSITRDFWPQSVVFDSADVTENDEHEFHFQIWLAGASPRQMDARTTLRLSQCQQLLWALRKDTSTANVEIAIKDVTARTTATSKGCEEAHIASNASPFNDSTGNLHTKSQRSGINAGRGSRSNIVFRAHKCVLETASFFSRMLNGDFMEAQADEHGLYRIELSNDMFDAEIMDHLLDYLYTREPISDGCEDMHLASCRREAYPSNVHGSSSYEPEVRHIISANVSLNLETIITEKTIRNPSGRYRHRNHHQFLLQTPGLTLWHWGALYRAATHLEDKELQAQTLQQIQSHLDPETTLEQVLKWGHQHEEVKTVMLEYLIKKRREVFGSEQRNQLRPYLWAEYEEQVETLVELTSQIARQ